MYVHLNALGCRLNEAELQTWGQQFQRRGLTVTSRADKADVIVLNTCAVTGEAARKSRQLIRRYHRQNPEARLVVTGCYASLEQEEAANILGVDRVIGNEEKDDLVNLVAETISLPTMPQMAEEPGATSLFTRGKDRAFIKIQDGCRYRCTYCIVTVARGEEKSRSIGDIVAEVNRHHRSGIQEIVLTGVHVGGYGSDIGQSLFELVQAILSDTDIPRIRFASVEPWDLPEGFFELFKNPRLMPHMHLPIQSGADSVLRRMSRRCKTSEFRQLLLAARQIVPDFNVTTDIIVGFPGETVAEWEATKAYIASLALGHIHIFSFSAREGTKAARLPDAVAHEIKKQRSKELHQIAATLKKQALNEQVGKQHDILWETDIDALEDKQFRLWGHTSNFHKVSMVTRQPAVLAGRVVPGFIKGVHRTGGFLEAEVNTATADTIAVKGSAAIHTRQMD